MIIPEHLADWGLAAAPLLGLLAALNPCPLLAQFTALLAVSGWGGSPGRNLGRGAVLAAGMAVAYAGLAMLLGLGLQRLPTSVLPELFRLFLAPAVILTGILMTGLFGHHGNTAAGRKIKDLLHARRWGWGGLFLLGMVLALAFCPATAGLFFGVLIPLAAARQKPVLDAALFGLGFGLPVLLLATAVAWGLQLPRLKPVAERITVIAGWFLIVLGAWLTYRLL